MMSLTSKLCRLKLETAPFKCSAIFSRSNSKLRTMHLTKPRMNPQDSVEVVKWVLLVIPVTSFGLGCWQTKRLQWKLNLIQNMQEKTNADPVDLPHDYAELESMEYSPVRVRGRFLHDKEILIGPRALVDNDSASSRVGSLVSDPNTNQGWLVVTPFQLSDTGDVILVNRGWIPQRLRPRESRAAGLVPGEVELTGVVRLSEHRPPFMMKNNPVKGQWMYRDLDEMAAHVGCSPVWLDARGLCDPPAGWPRPNQTRVALRNEHFSYLVTWFSLSGLTAFMWHRVFVRRLPLL